MQSNNRARWTTVGNLVLLARPEIDAEAARAFFAEALEAYARTQLSGNLTPKYIAKCARALKSLYRRLGPPWILTREDWEQYQSQRYADNISLGTRRLDQSTARDFQRYLCDPERPWRQRCIDLFSCEPQMFVDERYAIAHKEELEAEPNVRAFTHEELARFLAIFPEWYERTEKSGAKGLTTILRDQAHLATHAAFGLRNHECAMLAPFDFSRCAPMPHYGVFGSVQVRYGKRKARGPWRKRTVFLVPQFNWIVPVLRQYHQSVRPLYPSTDPSVLWPMDSGRQMTVNGAVERFAIWRERAGIAPELTLHSMRRHYSTTLVEAGYPERFIADQMGHDTVASTALYNFSGDDYRREVLRQTMDTLLGTET